jgi:hypothetical protein
MPREYAVVFLILAGLVLVFPFGLGGWAWVLVWPAASLAAVAVAYAGVGPAVFGKRPAGTLRPANVVLLLPFLLLAWSVWHALRLVSRTPRWNEVSPGLFIGRRALPGGLPEGTALVIDLTAEFAEPRGVRTAAMYRSLPMLDAAGPTDAARFREVVAEAAGFGGVVFVHCANGHGRSATFAAAVLLARGLASDVRSAVALVRAARPPARPGRAQLAALRKLVGESTDPGR